MAAYPPRIAPSCSSSPPEIGLSEARPSRARLPRLRLHIHVLSTGCVIAPNTSEANTQRMEDVRKMSEQATATCGVGNVKEVNSKSFTCK